MERNFKDLIAWQKSIQFVKAIYVLTEFFPPSELYGLRSQLRRAAVSVPSNIAEGQARHSKIEFRHFLRNARGSMAEITTQLTIARELGFINPKESQKNLALAEEITRVINGLIKSISE